MDAEHATKAVRKVLLWTPTVPLVLLQLFVRALMLCSVVALLVRPDARDRKAIEGFALLLQTFVFLFMDAQKVTAPKMRFVFAFILILRFFWSFFTRQTTIKWVEQYPLLPQTGLTLGFGTSSRQSIISSIDYTVITLMASRCSRCSSTRPSSPSSASAPTSRATSTGATTTSSGWRCRRARRDQDVADAALRVKSWHALRAGRSRRARSPGVEVGGRESRRRKRFRRRPALARWRRPSS